MASPNEATENPPVELTPELLRSYREGTLDDETSRRVETALAANPETRRALARDAGVEPIPVSDRLRSELLAHPRSNAEPRERKSLRPARWAAAVAAAAVASAVLWVSGRPDEPPAPALAFDVRVEAESLVRSGTASDTPVYPDTVVRITVEPQGAPQSGLEFRLYRRQGDGLIRVPPNEARVEPYRGAATISGRAESLAGARSGEHSLFVVVSTEADTPAERLELASDADPLEALAGTGRSVSSHTLYFASER